MMRIFAILVLTLAAAPAWAGGVIQWKPSVDAKDRTQEKTEGTVKKWGWKGGVEVVIHDGTSVTVARQNVVEVWRSDEERSKELSNALRNDDGEALKNIVKAAKIDSFDREEALYQMMAQLFSGGTTGEALAVHQQYIKEYPDGNYLDIAYQQLASLQLQAKKSEDALKTFGEMERLGKKQEAFACFKAGDLLLNNSKFDEASTKFTASHKAAEAVRDESLMVSALGYGGEALLRLKKDTDAKANFEKLFEVNTFEDALSNEACIARGIAHKGLGDLAGDTESAYKSYQLASFWLGGNTREGQCVLRMMQISETLSTKDPKWAERARKLKDIMRTRWPNLLPKS